jgi:hypothetical protein
MSKPTILERLENRFYQGDDPIPDTIRHIEELEERVKELERQIAERMKEYFDEREKQRQNDVPGKS